MSLAAYPVSVRIPKRVRILALFAKEVADLMYRPPQAYRVRPAHIEAAVYVWKIAWRLWAILSAVVTLVLVLGGVHLC